MLPPLVTNKQEHHENTTNVDSWYNVINTKSAYKTFSEGLWTRFYTRNTCAREETKIDSRT